MLIFVDTFRNCLNMRWVSPSPLAERERPTAYQWFCSARWVAAAEEADTMERTKSESDFAAETAVLRLVVFSVARKRDRADTPGNVHGPECREQGQQRYCVRAQQSPTWKVKQPQQVSRLHAVQ